MCVDDIQRACHKSNARNVCSIGSDNEQEPHTRRDTRYAGTLEPPRTFGRCSTAELLEQSFPGTPGSQRQRQRQEREQHRRSHRPSRQGGRSWTQLRKAPAGASEPAGDTIEKISQTLKKRSLSAWRPHSASRWCTQLRKTAGGEVATQLGEAPAGASEPAATAHRVSSARPQNKDSAMCRVGWIGQHFDRREGFATTLRIHPSAVSLAGISAAGSVAAHWNKKQKAQAGRGAVTLLATLWTPRRDTQLLEICSAQLRTAIVLQP